MKFFQSNFLSKWIVPLSSFLAALRARFWWIDVLYPIALAMTLFLGLTYIVYGGRESTRLSLLGERYLLELSLRYTPDFPLQHQNMVLTISADPIKMDPYSRSHRGLTPDVTVDTYATVIEKLGKQGVRDIVVIWRSENHSQHAQNYGRMRDVLSQLKDLGTNVIFVTNLFESNGIKSFVGDVAQVMDHVPCASADNDELQTYCPILEESHDWIAQWLYRSYYRVSPLESQTLLKEESWWDRVIVPRWRTRYVPSTVEGYITRMAEPSLIDDLAFASLLSADFHLVNTPLLAFVGVDLSGVIGSHTHPPMPIAITLPYPHWGQKKLVPLHRYWASLTQTFIDEKIPMVASPLMNWTLSLVIGVLILALMYVYGGVVASMFFCLWCLLGPLLNVVFLWAFDFYLPLFDSYYLGLSLLTVSGFARLSYTALSRWRVEEKSRSHLHAADLKANFISLLSHNINTPIAKMQGMLDLLTLNTQKLKTDSDLEKAETAHLQQAGFHVAQLQLVIKSVLVAITLEENAVHTTPRRMDAFIEEFKNSFGPLIRQLGIELEIAPLIVDHEDLSHLPLGFDARVLSTCLAALLGLGAQGEQMFQISKEESKHEKVPIKVLPKLMGESDRVKLILTVRMTGASRGDFTNWFESAKNNEKGFRGVNAQAFVPGVLAGVVTLGMESYGGDLEIEQHGDLSPYLDIHLSLIPHQD